MEFKVVNIIATARFGRSVCLDLEKIHRREKRSWYCKDIFSGLHLYLKKPLVTVTIFGNGKLNVVGAKSEADANRAAAIAGRRIRKACFPSRSRKLVDNMTAEKMIMAILNDEIRPVSIPSEKDLTIRDFRVVNIVARMRLPSAVDVNRFLADDQDGLFYEPEILNGLQFKLKHGKVNITLFHSGRLYATGFKDFDACEAGMKDIYAKLIGYCAEKQ